MPSWLPDFITMTNWETYLLELFVSFDDDWKQPPQAKFEGLPVIYNNKIINQTQIQVTSAPG
jgi:hypothetical protein